MEFRNHGRLGCPHDYDSLRQGLEDIIRRLQGAKKHIGKRPTVISIDPQQNRDLITKRRELQESIHAEDFALAANLRDSIKQTMETLQGNNG